MKTTKTIKNYSNLFKIWLNSYLDGSLFSYRRGYILTHPWKMIRGILNEVKWAYQRVFHGYDDRVIWGIDYYLDDMFPKWLKQLKKKSHGVPSIFFEHEDFDEDGNLSENSIEKANKKYFEVIDKIIAGFYCHSRMNSYDVLLDSVKYKIYNEKYEEGMDLLKKYYECLGD